MTDARGQLSLSVVEALVGLVLVIGTVSAFALSPPAPATGEAQLDRYARDTLTVLRSDAPADDGRSRLAALTRSAGSFEAEREAADRRIRSLLPAHLSYRVTTPHGTFGDPRPPAGRPVGRAHATTADGPVTLRVWSL